MLQKYRKKSFWVITLVMVLGAVGIGSGIYFGGNWIVLDFSSEQGQKLLAEKIPQSLEFISLLMNNFYLWVVPVCLGICLLLGWGLWGVLALSISTISKQEKDQSTDRLSQNSAKKDFIDHKIEQERKRRLFLHSLSVLQREGRLLDFFDEDLSLYEDEQIGAAVRSIQEDCKKAVKKYIDPKPVIDSEEGEKVTIETGFDIDAVKLVGNVVGQPPFEGVLKHRGWKAGKKDVPKLSDIQNPDVMTPAEVEIL